MSEKMKSAAKKLTGRPLILSIILAVLLTIFMELLGTGALALWTRPLIFLYNAGIIFLTLVAALLFPRRRFSLTLVSLVWIALGVINCVVMQMRGTPLSAIDFAVIKTGYKLVSLYLSVPQMVLIVLAAVLVIGGMVWVFWHSPRSKPGYKRILPVLAVMILAVIVPMHTGIRAERITEEYPDICDAYANYGFTCCFTYSIFNTGIAEPTTYNESAIRQITWDIKTRTDEPAIKPNIIMVQLESFFDATLIEGLEYSADPTPTFRKLRNTSSGGVLRVPVVGGGTANTEFEVLCGMSMEFFGIGEYPFETVLEEKPCESLGYTLKPLGYTAHAIHNYTGTFYDRNVVYRNLGFDTFTPMEYMTDNTYNALGWIRDMDLKGEIEKALDSTPGQDFVYTVSVQCHGQYPDVRLGKKKDWITVEGLSQAAYKNALEYYVNETKDVDDFIAALIEAVEQREEPTAVVVFGDHQPCLEIGGHTLKFGDEYDTEYVIWANFPMEKKTQDIEAYQLGATVLEQLGLPGGVFATLHQKNLPPEEYKQKLEMLQYDALFGESYAWAGGLEKSDMQMGLYPVTVSDVKVSGRVTKVSGENFTAASKIMVDGREQETQFISPTLLQTREKIWDGEVAVAQVAANGTVLSKSQPFLVD